MPTPFSAFCKEEPYNRINIPHKALKNHFFSLKAVKSESKSQNPYYSFCSSVKFPSAMPLQKATDTALRRNR